MDDAAKIQRIEKIDDERGELHPLLLTILPKIDRVKYVEYTDGPSEMGADFVVERGDDALESSTYIGVVAKTEKILQSFTEVERQIDECALPRLIRQGKLNVRLPEVWVITSKTVSQNAKQKICEKFSTRQVLFFDSSWLVRKIDEHAPYFWDEVTNTIGSYLQSADKRLIALEAQTSLIASSGARHTIELDIEEVHSDKYQRHGPDRRARLVNVFEEVASNKVTLIEARMGFGKSHVARRIARRYAENANYKVSGVLPVYASFRSFLEKGNKPLEAFVEESLGASAYADALAEDAGFLLILDGVDEAASDMDKCRECLDELVTGVRSNANLKLVLTSRPLKAFDELAASATSAKRYRIRELSVAKIIAYLQAVLVESKLPNHLLRDLGRSDLFKQLPQNPIAAALLANILSQEEQELPSNLTELYSKTTELMLGRWDERRQLSSEKLYKSTERLARHIARHMLDNRLIYMSRSEVRGMINDFMDDRNTGVPPEQVAEYLLERSNLFGVLDDTDAVFFRHRSFAEFLYARDAYEARDLAIDERAFHPYWVNTFFFYIGCLGECPDVLKKLAQLQPKDERGRFFKTLNMGQYLLAGYQTPYSVVEDSLDVVLLETAQLFADIKAGKIDSRIASFTEMQLLWVFAMTARHCYGYEFFAKGLPLAMAKIDDSLLGDADVKNCALLFAASALDEIGDSCGYQFLLERRKVQELPTAVSLALSSELEHVDKAFRRTATVKRYLKTLKHLLMPDPSDRLSVASKLDSLYKEPLSTKIAARKKSEVAKAARSRGERGK